MGERIRSGSDIKEKLKPFISWSPYIFSYQIITKTLIMIWLFLLGKINQALLRSSGRVAVTSGDWHFLFTTWQGILILLIALVSLFVYVALDLNTKIIISRNMLTNQKESVWKDIDEGFRSIGKLLNINGLGIVLYIAFIAPVLGVGLSISATEKLYIPTFITSVIQSSPLYSALAAVAALVFLSVGIANLFILHGIVIDGLPADRAGKQSRKLIKENWKDYLRQNVFFIAVIALMLAAVAAVFLILPLELVYMIRMPDIVRRFLTVFFVTAGVIISVLADLYAVPVYMMKMTQLFYMYSRGEDLSYEVAKGTSGKTLKTITFAAAAAVLAADCLVFAFFDQLFPQGTDVRVIAHRAGGNEGTENTVEGLEAAWKLGAYGSEIDIQRTKDGSYVLNHDGTFKRVAGVNKKPQDMTVREVKKLSVGGDQVPTLEEMLNAARGKMVLFIELKGNTADKRMADDAAALIKQYDMEDECVLISLKYELIDYIETNYPDIQTGFLTFASAGDTAGLNCDCIGLEEESAANDTISSIHGEGKQALVWTVNEKGSQKHFLCSAADGIITDNVGQAMKLITELENRNDLERMIDRIQTVF